MLAAMSRYFEEYQIHPPSGVLVVAVSGGADSLCLLHLLLQLCGPGKLLPELHLHVAHFDHQLRPSSSLDALSVAQVAQQWGLPYTLGKTDVQALAKEKKYSLEEAARVARYDFLRSVSHGGPIALAHHKDDQVESLLLHWLRGGGVAGLIGMLPKQDDLLRPLLPFSKDEILKYCREHHLVPLEDESNTDPRFLRNRVRHELLPLLEQLNPGFRETLLRSTNVLSVDVHWIEAQVEQAWTSVVLATDNASGYQLRLASLLALPLSIQRHLLRRLTAQLCNGQSPLEARHYYLLEKFWQSASSHTQKRLDLPGRLTLFWQGDSVWITKQTNNSRQHSKIEQSVFLSVPGSVDIAGTVWTITADLIEKQLVQKIQPLLQAGNWQAVRSLLPGDPLMIYLDEQAINYFPEGQLLIRQRVDGDRMQPLGMSQEKKIQDIFVDKHIPRADRDSVPLVCDQDHPLWLAGVQIDHRCRLRASSTRIIALSIHKHI